MIRLKTIFNSYNNSKKPTGSINTIKHTRNKPVLLTQLFFDAKITIYPLGGIWLFLYLNIVKAANTKEGTWMIV